VGAAAASMHKELVRQLKAPGRMFIPVGTGEQAIYIVDKDKDGHVTQKKVMDVRVSIVRVCLLSRVWPLVGMVSPLTGVSPRVVCPADRCQITARVLGVNPERGIFGISTTVLF